MIGEHRSRSLYVLVLVGLGVASLRPIAAVDAALDVLFAPSRLLAELARPLEWARAREVRAAAASILETHREEIAASRALLQAERRFARPSDPDLLFGRHATHGEVVQRSRGNLDRIWIRVSAGSWLEPGMPVVSGDHYVGRLADLPTEPGPDGTLLAAVDLVTGNDVFVGARLVAAGEALDGCRIVVGGLAPPAAEREAGLYLSALYPSCEVAPEPAWVEVFEPPFEEDVHASLANGFRLGSLQVVERDDGRLLRIRPGLDYKEGLYQVLVLGAGSEVEREVLPDAFEDRLWRPARVFLAGHPSPWREGRKIALGRWHGIERGATLAFGTRFAGRVLEPGLFTASVGLLGDPGLVVPAIARIEGREEPLVLGHLVSLGRGSDGRVRLRWEAVIPAPGPAGSAPVRARLYTGSGAAGVPRGLLIGEAELAPGEGVHVLAVESDPAVFRLDVLSVRVRPRPYEEVER